jgi:phosphoglycolate phosphatase-like HAD superfamily hydrolase
MTDPKVLELAELYNQNVTHGAATCAELPGATRCLEGLKGNIPMVLLSATPEKSLQEIIRIRNWGHFFEEVLGYPRYKPDELARLMKQFGVSSEATLMVGDSDLDERAATENKVPFWDIRKNANLLDLRHMLLEDSAMEN